VKTGYLLVDKPKGITSHDVIYKVRKITGVSRVGHAGTLDPNATGLLIVGVGREATKTLGILTKDTTKEYRAEIYLGESRDSDDIEGTIVEKSSFVPSLTQVKKCLESFLGKQKQIPPIYSAIKKDGKKAYEVARSGKIIVMDPRDVEIFSVHMDSYEYPYLTITTLVSSGTYIRSLARDIGECLNTKAYLSNLRRTKIGNYSINEGILLSELTNDNWESSIQLLV
jgi:tRNA pseudouridine55 synthase